MSRCFPCDQACYQPHEGHTLAHVLPVSPRSHGTDKNEPTTSYATTGSQGISFLNSGASTQCGSYSSDDCEASNICELQEVPHKMFPGYQERDVEDARTEPAWGSHLSVQQRNKVMQDVADFLCEVPQTYTQ